MKKVIKAGKGTPEQFLEALENRLDELGASADLDIDECDDIYSVETIEGSYDVDDVIIPKSAMLDWLSRQGDAYEGIEEKYNTNLADEDEWFVLDHIRNYDDNLYDDFLNYFNIDIDYPDSMDEPLMDIIMRYAGSRRKPYSGSWDTEDAHMIHALSDELGISLEKAAQIDVYELGNEPAKARYAFR